MNLTNTQIGLCIAGIIVAGLGLAVWVLWKLALEENDREETFRDHSDYDGDFSGSLDRYTTIAADRFCLIADEGDQTAPRFQKERPEERGDHAE